jgi:hypothetical protein
MTLLTFPSLAPYNAVETQEVIECDCGETTEDVTVTWDGEVGSAECPECHVEVEIHAPDPDYEGMRDDR